MMRNVWQMNSPPICTHRWLNQILETVRYVVLETCVQHMFNEHDGGQQQYHSEGEGK